jgi:hypothetical protein
MSQLGHQLVLPLQLLLDDLLAVLTLLVASLFLTLIASIGVFDPEVVFLIFRWVKIEMSPGLSISGLRVLMVAENEGGRG